MRELNKFNQIILEKFSSKQAYTQIKGHYIPIVMGNISDESVMDLEKRKFYIQSYEFTVLGFLIDENEFTVSPAVSRVLKVFEVDETKIRRQKKSSEEVDNVNLSVLFVTGTTTIHEKFYYSTNLKVVKYDNVATYDVYINNEYYGSDISEIQINTNDVLKINITKVDNTKESTIDLQSELV